MFNPEAVWHSSFLIHWQSFHEIGILRMTGEVTYTHTGNDYDRGRLTIAIISREKSQIGGDIFFQLYSTNATCMVDFIEISGNRCVNANIH